MTIDTEPRDATDMTVLVAHVSFAVGAALAHRLAGRYAAITLVHAETILSGRSEHPCDLLLLCPYMTPAERDGILARMAARPQPLAVLELCDRAEGPRAYVRGEWNDEIAARLDMVLEDLAVPLEAADA